MKKTFRVYDSKASAFLPPFYRDTAGQATRDFEELANEDKHIFNRHPGDFTLFETGTDDECLGLSTNHQAHINLGLALSFIEPAEPTPINKNTGFPHEAQKEM